MKISAITAAAALAFLGACANLPVPAPPRQGLTADPTGGPPGYQHGGAGGKFVLGATVRDRLEYGYIKKSGDQGTLAIRQANGSSFGIPDANATGLRLGPYGSTPQDHDKFVRDYFVGLGLPVDQVMAVRGMTLLEASGKSDETSRPMPRITAYYSVLQRGIGDVAVPDSFAWARANAEGHIVHEAVYWPALPAAVLDDTRKFKAMLADPEQRRQFEARIGMSAANGTLVIRHAGATEDRFESFASLDFTVRATAGKPERPAREGPGIGGASVVRHFDLMGTERFLPQERLQLGDKYPETKVPPPARQTLQ
jgi:hypothetical protein